MNITSRDNSLLRHARAVRDGKANESIFVEGLRLCEEALRSGLKIEAVIFSEQIARKERAERAGGDFNSGARGGSDEIGVSQRTTAGFNLVHEDSAGNNRSLISPGDDGKRVCSTPGADAFAGHSSRH